MNLVLPRVPSESTSGNPSLVTNVKFISGQCFLISPQMYDTFASASVIGTKTCVFSEKITFPDDCFSMSAKMILTLCFRFPATDLNTGGTFEPESDDKVIVARVAGVGLLLSTE